MSKRRREATQLPLFGEVKPRKLKPEPLNLPPMYPQQVSYSAIKAFEACFRRYWLLYPGNWWGWDNRSPQAVQDAYWQKRLEPWRGWTGHLVHEFVADTLFNDIDSAIAERTGVSPMTEDELIASLKHRFESGWEQSRNWSWDTFRKVRRKDSPLWLLEHERKQWPTVESGLRNPVNTRRKNQCWDWVERSARNFLLNRYFYFDGAPFPNWLVIEGLSLRNGIVLNAGNEVAQATLRAKRTFPEALLDVDGESWRYSFTVDFMTFNPESQRYLIVDFKTGTDKYWQSHRDQLQLYGAFAMMFLNLPPGLPQITEANLDLRAVYSGLGQGQTVRDWRLFPGEGKRLIALAKEQVRTLRRHLLRLDELTAEEKNELSRLLPPHLFVGPDGLFESETGGIREGVAGATLVALASSFPPRQAREARVRMCENCSALKGCQEGLKLLEIARSH